MKVYRLTKGCARNPLSRYRNLPCPCKSGKKVKKCCGRYSHIKQESADKINEWLESVSLKTMEDKSGVRT